MGKGREVNEIVVNINLKLSPSLMIDYAKALRKLDIHPDDFVVAAVAQFIDFVNESSEIHEVQ
jgi:hypothetical protein